MKTVLITGASKGIGRAIAKEFANNGYAVAINYNKYVIKRQNSYIVHMDNQILLFLTYY